MYYYCSGCERWWNYPIKKCIFCGEKVQEIVETEFKVIGFTQIQVPSKENPDVPYYNYLLKDKNDNKIIIKSFEEYSIGDLINLDKIDKEKNIYKVGIIGTGQMGYGIAEHVLKNGHFTIIKTRTKNGDLVSKIKNRLLKDYTPEELKLILKKLIVTEDYSKMSDCDIIIEAVPEDIEIKKTVFKELSKHCKKEAIFATNTSSISIDDLAMITDRPEKFIGVHFFNPVSRMSLIEVIIGNKTSKETHKWILSFCEELKKTPITVKNSPGFIVNRLLLPQINEAILLMEQDIAKKEDIDQAMKLGLNHPMGPFQLADFIGLDICLSILETIYEKVRYKKYKPAKTLVEMVKEGRLGMKSGEGFYKY